MINNKFTLTNAAQVLNLKKSHVSYYVKKAKAIGYVNEVLRDKVKIFELTQAGLNFLAVYETSLLDHQPICRAENIRFKADILRMPTIPVDWHKVEMNHWNQYNSEVNGIKVHVNDGNQPTIEFIPGAIDGNNPDNIKIKLMQDCTDVAHNLEERLNMRIGRLELSSKGEWVVYDPVAKAYSKQFGQITVDGVGKVNASLPRRRGEFEFHDVRDAADYMTMPRRLNKIEQRVEEIFNILKEKKSDTDEGGKSN